jgi:lysozyme
MLRRLLGFLRPGRSAAPPAPAVATPGAIPVLLAGEAPQAPSVPPAAVEMVARFEGFRATAYRCPAEVWTIGYGATRWGHGGPVREGDTIEPDAARRLLARDLADAAEAVAALVRVPLHDSAFSALISFVFNVGRGAFARSAMLTHINAGRMADAAAEFPRWNQAGGRVLPGLVRRRGEEMRLFLSG